MMLSIRSVVTPTRRNKMLARKFHTPLLPSQCLAMTTCLSLFSPVFGEGPCWSELFTPETFCFDGAGLLMHISRPAIAACLYFVTCVVHNWRMRNRRDGIAAPPQIIKYIAISHNAALVVFSALVFIAVGKLLVEQLSSSGLHRFLCPAPLHQGGQANPPKLCGPLYWWCYLFYLSKYYEMGDTLLLILRGKRIIPLHALHHALIPVTMVILFEGGVSVSLIGLGFVNSFVHVIMYSYYLACACGRTPPEAWKRRITQLQIMQFSAGVLGGTYYWIEYFADVQFHSSWPFVTFTENCAGGTPITVLCGYVMNAVLLVLFVRFYLTAYKRRPQLTRKQA
eukprot:3559115-Pleurochrysis_carterae.AAC.1